MCTGAGVYDGVVGHFGRECLLLPDLNRYHGAFMYLLVLRGLLGILYSVGYSIYHHQSLSRSPPHLQSGSLTLKHVLDTPYWRAGSRALSSELALRLRDPISSLASVQMPGPSVWDGCALSVAVGFLSGRMRMGDRPTVHHGAINYFLFRSRLVNSLAIQSL